MEPMTKPTTTNERVLRLQHQSLCIEFQWKEDRFHHRVLLNSEEVGKSVEGDSSSAWPPSPPLQDLSLEDINGTPAILGVGRAGKGHWSISIQWDESQGGFLFDLACRAKELGNPTPSPTEDPAKEPPATVGSVYEVTRTGTMTFSPMACETIEEREGRVKIEPNQVGDPTVRWGYLLTIR